LQAWQEQQLQQQHNDRASAGDCVIRKR
jgi:hypothetical protein